MLLDLGFTSSWESELKAMNKHKVGRPFDFPDSYKLGFIKVGSVQNRGRSSF